MAITVCTSQTAVDAIPTPKFVTWIGPGNRWEVRTGSDVPSPQIPDKVTRRQFKQGLTRLGLRAAVDAWRLGLDTATPAGQDAADWYDDSNEFERRNPILASVAAQFGLSSAQVDAAFLLMAGL